ncbi:MAG: AAA family ATPase [Patescibacteria group bacterium]
MLKSIEIKKFRNLSKVKLKELTDVNILTGENGSGKSQVLQYIISCRDDIVLLKDGLNNKYSSEITIILDKITDLHLSKLDYEDLVSFLPVLKRYYQTNGVERGGLDKLIKICKLVYKLSKYDGVKIFLMDEPETHLHPKLQKDISRLCGVLAVNLKVQFIIETHSPFVISEAASLVDYQEKQSRNYKAEFYPSQKVYFMKNGKLTDKNGVAKVKGQYGYWGSKVNSIAGKMLGAGLMDLVAKAKFDLNDNSPYLVFCEGQGKDEDEKFYNSIFQNHSPRALFVSSRGTSQLESTFELLRQIRAGLAANFKILMVRDRDHEFCSEKEITSYQKNKPGVKVLRRRAIECYMYNSEVVRVLYSSLGKKCELSLLNRLDKLHDQIQKEAENGVRGDSYKNRLKKSFTEAISDLELADSFYSNLNLNIAKLIEPKTTIYKELERIIFG